MKRIVLLLLVLAAFNENNAQVFCGYHGLKDTLTKEMLTNLTVSNMVRVKIHSALDARAFDATGRIVYRYYVPKLESAVGRESWSVRPGETRFGRAYRLLDGGEPLLDELNLSGYTGDLKLSLTLRHPLDTQSIIARKEMVLPLVKGVIDFERVKDKEVRQSTGYFVGLRAELPEFTGRFTPEKLGEIKLVNTSGHTICEDVEISLNQQGGYRSIYAVKLTEICIPPGEHAIGRERAAAAVSTDRFAERDTLRSIQLQCRLAGVGSTRTQKISARLHGAVNLPVRTFFNPALNIAVDFVDPLEESAPMASPGKTVVVKDSAGRVLDVVFPRSSGGLSLAPANPYGATFFNRETETAVLYRVLRSDDLETPQLESFMDKILGGDLCRWKTVQRGDFELVFPTDGPAVAAGRLTKRPPAFLFAARYRALIYIFGVFATDSETDKGGLGRREIIRRIELNGHRFRFRFAPGGGIFPEDVAVVPGANTVSSAEAVYTKRLKTFLYYAGNVGATPGSHRSLVRGEDRSRLDELLGLPFTDRQLDSVSFPAMQQEVLGDKRFDFVRHEEAGFRASWGVPAQVARPGFSLAAKSTTGSEWATTFGIDKDGNLTKWSTPGVSNTYGEVVQEISLTGRQVMYYSSMYPEANTRGFSFAVAEFPAGAAPKEFYRAITMQLNGSEHSVRRTMLHQNEGYDVYRSPLIPGFLYTTNNPGMSVLVTGGEKLYQFTAVGINEGEVLRWLNTVKLEGKQLRVEGNRTVGYKVRLE